MPCIDLVGDKCSNSTAYTFEIENETVFLYIFLAFVKRFATSSAKIESSLLENLRNFASNACIFTFSSSSSSPFKFLFFRRRKRSQVFLKRHQRHVPYLTNCFYIYIEREDIQLFLNRTRSIDNNRARLTLCSWSEDQ